MRYLHISSILTSQPSEMHLAFLLSSARSFQVLTRWRKETLQANMLN